MNSRPSYAPLRLMGRDLHDVEVAPISADEAWWTDVARICRRHRRDDLHLPARMVLDAMERAAARHL